MTKLLLLDLDGTVRRTRSGDTFINDPHDQQLIEGVKEALAVYKDWYIVGITNQGGVPKYKSLKNAIKEQQITIDLTQRVIETIYFSPGEGNTCVQCGYRGDTNSWHTLTLTHPVEGIDERFRKPDPGMLKLAIQDCFRKVTEALYVGDRMEDQEAANRAEIPFMWANEWRTIFFQMSIEEFKQQVNNYAFKILANSKQMGKENIYKLAAISGYLDQCCQYYEVPEMFRESVKKVIKETLVRLV